MKFAILIVYELVLLLLFGFTVFSTIRNWNDTLLRTINIAAMITTLLAMISLAI